MSCHRQHRDTAAELDFSVTARLSRAATTDSWGHFGARWLTPLAIPINVHKEGQHESIGTHTHSQSIPLFSLTVPHYRLLNLPLFVAGLTEEG
jgi:hypothetical protein